ncbi:MAG TPA: amidohydrolase family protein [Xanthobacteraceae bacterium]|nr:amidohydrolase family protein [Xanthobacteraceae bacterium]
MIADAQIHIWGDETPERPWVPGGQARLRHMGHLPSLTADALVAMMDEGGVDRAVIVPPTWDYDRLDVGLDSCARYPDRFRIMARIPVNRPDEARALLEQWRGNPMIAGVRLTFSFEGERDWILDGTADWFWPYAEAHDIAVMLLVPHAKAKVAEIAATHPKLRIAIDHLGIFGNTVDQDVAPYVEATVALANHPNISVKLTNLPSFSTAPYPFENLMPHVESLVRAFGAERCFWGTDISRMLGKYGVSYPQAVALVNRHMLFLNDAQKRLILGEALCGWLRWPVNGSAHS